MIKVSNLSKTFRVHEKEPGLFGSVQSLFIRKWLEKKALQDVSFEVGPGEIVGLVGANGAGKTTLVKILSGIIHRDSGDVEVLGFDPWERNNIYRRQISLVMGQKAQLWWDLPAADCFLLLKEIYQIPDKDFRDRLEELSSELRIQDQLKIQIRRLSLGERMKMELVAALLHQPKVIFLDEPTIGLDVSSQRAIRQFLRSYKTKHQPAVILTSHYMDDIEQLCERIVLIDGGHFVYDGSLQTVLEKFADERSVTIQVPLQEEEQQVPGEFKKYLIFQESGVFRFLVPRNEVPEVVGKLLQSLSVLDLQVDEEDVGTIIEKVVSANRGAINA